MSLLAFQRQFGAWLRDGEEETASAGRAAYLNNYRGSLTACLTESFARTHDWIGDEAFTEAMIRHIRRVPPSAWTLDAYGRDFPDTLASLYPDDPEVAELAEIEWALGEAFVGPDAPVIGVAEAAHVDWDDAVLHFIPTLDHRPIMTNAPAIWAALGAGGLPPAAELMPEPSAMIVWRDHFTARFRTIDPAELQALLLARSGLSFAALCEALVAGLGEEAGIAFAGACLGRWLADGLVCRISAPCQKQMCA